MIIKEMAYKVTLQAQEFLSGKQKVQKESEDLANSINNTNKRTANQFSLLTKGVKDFGDVGKNSFSLLQSGAAKFLGVALTLEGARRMFMGTTEQLVRMGNTAGFLGMSTQSLDGFTKAAQAGGSSAESAASNLMRLKNSQLLMQTGMGAPDATTRALMMLSSSTGIDILGQRDPGQMMMQEARALRQLPRAQSQVMAGQLGIDSSLYQSMMSPDWQRNVQQFTNQSNKTPAAVQQAMQVQKAMVDLRSSIEAVEVSMVQAFGPDVTKGLNSLSDWIKNNKDGVTGFFKDAANGAQQLSDSVGGIGNLLKIYAGWKVGGIPGAIAAAGSVGVSSAQDAARAEGKSTGEYLIEQANKPKKPLFDYQSSPDNSMYGGVSGDGILDTIKDTAGDAWDHISKFIGFGNANASEVNQSDLLNSIMLTESGGNPNARSGAGAVGAFQFMPGTARDMGLTVNSSIDDRLNPEKSRVAASKYMSQLLTHYRGNVNDALMAYNWGAGNMDKWISGGRVGNIPQETMNYPGRVASYYGRIAQGAMMRPSGGSYDSSQTNTTHIDRVIVNSNPTSVNQLTQSIDEQASRSRVTVSFSGGTR